MWSVESGKARTARRGVGERLGALGRCGTQRRKLYRPRASKTRKLKCALAGSVCCLELAKRTKIDTFADPFPANPPTLCSAWAGCNG